MSISWNPPSSADSDSIPSAPQMIRPYNVATLNVSAADLTARHWSHVGTYQLVTPITWNHLRFRLHEVPSLAGWQGVNLPLTRLTTRYLSCQKFKALTDHTPLCGPGVRSEHLCREAGYDPAVGPPGGGPH